MQETKEKVFNETLTQLVNVNEKEIVVVSSREVAEHFCKEHRNVIRDIENIVSEGMLKIEHPLFIESQYQHEQNKQYYKEYLLTRDGFTLLAMGFTGKEALQWKLKYIEAFNKMEDELKQQRPMCVEDVLINQLEEQKKIKQQLNQVNHNALEAKNTAIEVKAKLDTQMTINSTQQKIIQDSVKHKVGERLKACSDFDHAFDAAERKAQFFSSLYGDLKRRFGVPTYRDILFKDFDNAASYIKGWIEPAEIR